MNELSFWKLVQEHLDARRDPLNDHDVRQFLEDNPQCLPAFAELQHSLRALQPVEGVPLRRRKIPWAAVAVLLLAVVALWFLQPPGGDPELPLPDLAHNARVLHLDITVVVLDHETRTERRVDRGNYIRREVETITYLNPKTLTSLEIAHTRRFSE